LSVGQTLQILQVWVLWRVKSREQCIGRTFQRQRIPDGQNYRHEAVLLEAQGASALSKEPRPYLSRASRPGGIMFRE